jgi:hypothetical protein
MPNSEFETAKETVKNLELVDFIQSHKPLIYEKIRDCEERVSREPAHGDMTFIATCLPIAAGIIHMGTKLDSFKKAQEKLSAQLRLPDSTSVLSALTLLYVVHTAWEDNKGDPVWERIHNRVQRFLGGELSMKKGAASVPSQRAN